MQDSILIRGARVHNLKNLTLAIPHHQLTVVTGVSGSGKSSLVFDTIYAEGQRRYVESMSAYARQFLERMEKPDIDEIEGIAPPVAIKQKNTTRNPRSTVATSTEIYDFLRLLYARAGQTWCPNCHKPVERDTVDQVAMAMLRQPLGSRWYALFPVVVAPTEAPKPDDKPKKAAKKADTAHPRTLLKTVRKERVATGDLRDRLFELRGKGFNRLFQNGRIFEFSSPESLLDIDFTQPLFALADRFGITEDLHQRVVDTTEICYREAGEVIFEEATPEKRQLRFSEAFSCKTCGKEFQTPEPRLFSFNNPFGACPKCQGFGNTIDYDLDLIIPDRTRSLDEGAVDPWTKPSYEWHYEEFKRAHKGQLPWHKPYHELSKDERKLVEAGVREFFAEVEKKKYKVHVRVFLSRYRGYARCTDCDGSRLRPEALYVQLSGRTVGDVTRLNIAEALAFFATMTLPDEARAIADRILVEIRQRLRFLNDVGLEYLTLDRLSATLSGGEAQRIQLATCLGSQLVGACYVLDEPSIGLHSRDTGRLIKILHELRDLGNTILVVEHDSDVMRAADHLIDLGPGAGEHGGQLIYEGTFDELVRWPDHPSRTGFHLRAESTARPATGARRPVDKKRQITFRGCRANNLRNIDVEIPLGLLVCVTGVSGSGKSTLVHDVIHRTLARRYKSEGESPASESEAFENSERQTCRDVERAGLLSNVVLVDQSPIGRTPRSNPVTYVKAFDLIRELFASTPEAKKRGYSAGHFSFNIPGGRCETCQGDGTVTVEMQFLADVELICDDCKGTRYKPALLEIQYRERNIHQVLRLSVSEAMVLFADQPKLHHKLRVLEEVGLGYLRLGQSATTLSGGEAQRVKLAAHLALASCGGTLFIFDEPTTGLHFDDIAKLLTAFQKLIEQGGSVLLIEHNMDVIRAADWLIDLGPEGGAGGGLVVGTGTPEAIAKLTNSYTGQFLAAAMRGVARPTA
ncbi:MAG: excinuclease ABC subunit UvrA [Bryobacteraceae bacterium]|nr:excinuclease ABC subunit UvrA [Bryobacteraceae bacterium]